ncbi:tight junction protein ZO-3-like isoform X2 [Lycorma delicatula]|uniref:tight junction protein ZO-3-like isoform X2 n=1 Tax=Lycorma delicatula TaxID=130591 RepID=UPI003F50F9F2
MAGTSEVVSLLEKHKNTIVRELSKTNILTVLVKKGVLSPLDEDLVLNEQNESVKGDVFIELISRKGVDAFKEFCFALETECPHVLTNLLAENLGPPAHGDDCETEGSIRHIDSDAKDSDDDQLDCNTSNRDNDASQSIGTVTTSSSPPSSPICNGGVEMLEEPVEEVGGERIVWEFHQVTLTRVPGYGFGIAVSGGRDNPHFTNGDPSIAISDVLKAGPAEGKLLVNDRIMSANGVSLENVEYATAVQVLRDSGNTVTLVVRRRVVLPASPEPQTLRFQLTKSRKKDDFGLVLGCKIFVREVGKLDGNGLQEGDVLLKINNHSTDGMSLKEARKLIESSKEKLNLVVRREAPRSSTTAESTALQSKEGNYLDGLNGSNYTSQNLYVQPPTRQQMLDDKSNLLPRGRSRGPLLDVSLSQLDRPASPQSPHHSHSRSRSGLDEPPDPPRPPPPRPEDYYSSNRQLYDDDPILQRSKQPMPDPRFITFQKEGSVGIRLTGGNEVGIFVTAVQPGSPASLQGLQPGDKILKVNDMDMKGVTREEAVLFLLSLQEQIHLIVQHRRDEYEQIVAAQRGDSFHIKAHFNYDQPNKGEMSFRKGDVFHVVDTLHNGVVGAWQVFRIGRNNQEVQKGIIPNKARAEELATAQFNATKKELTASESRGSFFRRRRNSHRRSKSLSKDHWDDVVFGDSVSKFPAYERVTLRHPGFIRPVVLFGPVSDIAREKLLKDFPDKFSSPQLENNMEEVSKSQKTSGIIRLSAIRDIMERGKHALLDITPNAVDRLNYAQFYPIVIFLRADSKHIVKELRAGLANPSPRIDFQMLLNWTQHKSSKKLFEQCQKLEKVWGHVFSCSISLGGADLWYRKVRELIDKHQTSPVWMSESKPDEALSDDFLFPMTSLRLSYASSPESDLEQGASLPPRLVKCSSDPSIATQEDTAPVPPPYTPPSQYNQPTYDHNHKPRRSGDKYGFSPPHSPLVSTPPELPPRIDRANKPPRTSVPRSAQERLFGGSKENSDPPNYINATPHHRTANSSLERHNPNKASSYDSVSSFDSYNQRLGLGPNAHDDLKSCNGNVPQRSATTSHDPYRFTRSTQQPIKSNPGPLLDPPAKPVKPPDYPKYRPPGVVPEYNSKPLPPPKSTPSTNTSNSNNNNNNSSSGSNPHQYKPVPPPKPKNYRPPQQQPQQQQQQSQQQQQQQWSNYNQTPSHPANGTMYQHTKSYSMADNNNYTTHLHNGVTSTNKYSSENIDLNGGFDSGHGSSLDRTYGRGGSGGGGGVGGSGGGGGGSNSHQYYYNVAPGTRHHHHREPSGLGLDLTHRADQRGSAFELYKKPTDPRNMHYLEHTLR